MLKIDYLKNHPHFVPVLAKWAFDTWGHYNLNSSVERSSQRFNEHLNENQLPLTLVAFKDNVPIGMASLRASDGCDHLGQDFTPWLGSLFVVEQERSKGVAQKLVQEILQKAKNLGFLECYLLTFQRSLVDYYKSLGWRYLQDSFYNEYPITIMKTTM